MQHQTDHATEGSPAASAAIGGVRLVHAAAGEVVALKPAGLSVEVPRDPEADSLLRRLRDGGLEEARLVHRLDAPACGLVLVARSRAAAAHYAAEIAARRWIKWYVARVAVPPRRAAGLVGAHKAYLKTDGRTARVVRAGGKPSFLDVTLAAPAGEDGVHSHLLVRLHTGRLHQIRVMLAHLGAPLAGDWRYGNGADASASMYLEHAVVGAATCAGDWMVWTAPPHADREPWDDALTAAVADVAATARRAPPPREPER